MPYEFPEGVTRADVAFRASAPTLEGLFASAADALMQVMAENLDAIRPAVEKNIALENDSLEMLLFDFLQELVYFKDAEKLLLRVPAVRIENINGRHVLRAAARGERLDPRRHRLNADVKAVTLHRFSLRRADAGWEALVVLDI